MPNQVSVPDQHRSDLRMALKAPDRHETQDKTQVEKNATPQRHLSDQERNNLREQLRQQHPDVK